MALAEMIVYLGLLGWFIYLLSATRKTIPKPVYRRREYDDYERPRSRRHRERDWDEDEDEEDRGYRRPRPR